MKGDWRVRNYSEISAGWIPSEGKYEIVVTSRHSGASPVCRCRSLRSLRSLLFAETDNGAVNCDGDGDGDDDN